MSFGEGLRNWRAKMRLEGWLLDVRFRKDYALLWVKVGDRRIQLKERYNVDFFVSPDKVSHEKLVYLFDEHDHIVNIEKSQRFLSIDSKETSPVQRIYVDSVAHHRDLVRLVSKYGDVFDTDLSHSQRYLADRALTPFGELVVDVNEQNIITGIEGVPLGLNVEPPPFKVLCFELHLENDVLEIVTLNQSIQEEYRFNGFEAETLQSFTEYLKEYDPDMIACMETDLKKLFSLQIKHGLPISGYFHRKGFHLDDGRVYLNLMSYRRMSLAGMVERIQYTREVPRIASDWAAGRAIESRQSYEARRRGYLLPRNGFYQPVMNLEELLRERDHGGLIFAPTVGLHENVGALDFESMFPQIILKHNISYENVRTEREAEGFLLDFTRDTLDRRLYFKHLRKDLEVDPKKWFWCETRQQALKEILFCTYGYSGCWANKFGNMDTFMEINNAARINLVKAMNIARGKGFHTIYGNSDSLFLVKKGATRNDFDSLTDDIYAETILPITVENHFRYLVLLPQKSGNDFGAINRYFGVTYNGKLVCRGIELRRRNTSPLVVNTQRKAIHAMLSHESAEDVLSKGVEDAKRVIDKACRKLKKGLVPIEELEASTILRRKPSKYKARLPHVAAAEALSINGLDVEKGNVISYVYVDADHKNPFRRVSPAGYQNNFDAKKYVRLVNEAGRSIMLPFLKEEEKERETTSLESFFTP
jgi:DNA polymerase elongation subunit (family B)